MVFSWDEAKRLRTIEDRGLDFVRAERFFDGRPVVQEQSSPNGEARWKSTVEMDNNLFTMIWMWRGEIRHIISMRRAHGQEIRKYRDLFR